MFGKMGLSLIITGLMLLVAGCGGGNSSSKNIDSGDTATPTVTSTATSTASSTPTPSATPTPTINLSAPGTYTINLSYEVTNSSGDTIELTITSIEVESDQTLKVNCAWTVANNSSGSAKIIKVSDADTTTFYIVDNNGSKYYHTSGDGAAYTTTELSATAVSGSYDFPALNSGVTSIYFYDSVYSQKTGLILVTE